MKRLFIFLLLIISIIPAFGQQVSVTSSVDTSRIFIGDQLKYTITIDQPAGLNLILPLYKDTLCKNIEIISGPVIDSSAVTDGRIKIIENYLITSFDSGLYQIPPAFAEIKNENGLKRFYSDYTQLEVMRVKIAPADTTAKIFDIIKPYKAPVTIGEIVPWFLLAAALAVIIWFAIRFIRRLKKSEKGVEALVNPEPAHVIAFRDLEKLREDKLWQKGEIKHYYTRLTEILRQYLENRFGVFSLELTTSETLDALVRTGFKKDVSYNLLRGILVGADLVKFAKYNPEPSENESHFQNSWDFVLATKENEIISEAVDKKGKTEEGSL